MTVFVVAMKVVGGKESREYWMRPVDVISDYGNTEQYIQLPTVMDALGGVTRSMTEWRR